ncbi:pyrokinin-1 receptor [Lucilia cuprina]|uniref:pyrokinin-1 receptor n=1 Tax=Lucilia cuprina TaxID=7375 RepID=UPI001F05E5FF|nr:pyrokinin-1 receptor [Lucilia cuprina]XP_046805707.1 pyrokinin-1 receptor [Lucilia cuprina]XP_046805708.1 pyrokinin-1 receptor [Lucilia cuprina]XP_046805709.1 pyrokinin-1 receptor [Lucilia cuprina]XP_046805710.1 pyrokinin-1 receptor [Lucilia cuprina]
MTKIIYDTTAAMNNSDFVNSTYMFAEATDKTIYETGYDFEQSIFGPKRDSLKIVIPVTVIYVLIFITGVIGNISTCIVIKKNRSMHTATNYYLFSLAISDFMLLLSGVPQEVYMTWYKYPYPFGEYFCVGRGIVAETSANATVLTITAFTVERYVAICHPFFGQAISKLSRAIRIIIIIWLLSILTAIPQALQFGIVSIQGVENCVLANVIIKHSFQLSTYIFFFAPMSIIFVLYLLIGVRLYRSNVIDGSSSGGGHNNSNSKDLHRFRNDLSIGLNSSNSHVRRGRLGMKSTQSDTILYRYSGGTQVSAVRGRINQFGTKRVLKMLVAVVICFFLCWAPFHAQRLIAVYGSSGLIAGGEENTGMSVGDDSDSAIFNLSLTTEQIFAATEITTEATALNYLNFNSSNNNKQREQHTKVYTVMTYISGVLYYLSTCINPLLYNLMSNKFRQAFKSILFGKKSSNARRSQNSQRSMSRKATTTHSSSIHRGSSESEMQSKVSLLQTISNERKFTPQMIP